MTSFNEEQLFHLSFSIEPCRAQETIKVNTEGELRTENPIFGKSRELSAIRQKTESPVQSPSVKARKSRSGSSLVSQKIES